MRTTLDIDDDVLAAAKELARTQAASTGAVVSGLLRQALSGCGAPVRRTRAVAGFRPFPADGRVVGGQQVDALRDAEGVRRCGRCSTPRTCITACRSMPCPAPGPSISC